MSVKKALITGVNGQDGVYLAKLLLDRGYEVHGLLRWDSYVDGSAPYDRFALLGVDAAKIHFHTGDVCDAHGVMALVDQVRPDVIYNLAAISHVSESFKYSSVVMDVISKGALNLLEAVLRVCPTARYYQASSSEMFGAAPAPQDELAPMIPQSPYGVAKLSAYHLIRIYREQHGLFAVNGILFNHESPLRGYDFVTQKIAQGVAAIDAGRLDALALGNLDAKRDWGHAADYVRGMAMMVDADSADDYVLATGVSYSVREFVEAAFAVIGEVISWQGQGVNEVGVDANSRVLVRVSQDFYRPLEVHHLEGDASKALSQLGWLPEIGFDDLVREMVLSAKDQLRHADG